MPQSSDGHSVGITIGSCCHLYLASHLLPTFDNLKHTVHVRESHECHSDYASKLPVYNQSGVSSHTSKGGVDCIAEQLHAIATQRPARAMLTVSPHHALASDMCMQANCSRSGCHNIIPA